MRETVASRSFYDVVASPDEPSLGALFYALLIAQESWVYRRVETFTVVEERRFRRQMSIDFRMPDWIIEAAETLGLTNLPVPLLLLEKRALVAFDLRDASGKSLPALDRMQNGALSIAALDYAFAAETSLPTLEGLPHQLHSVVMKSVTTASELLEHLASVDGHESNEAITRLKWAVATLDTRFVLVADMPIAELRERTVVKVGYEEEVFLGTGKKISSSETKWWATAKARFGLSDAAIILATPEISSCESYHFEIRTPSGIDCASVALTLDDVPPDKATVRVDRGAPSGSIGHLVASLDPSKRLPTQGPLDFKVVCSLRPSLDGFVLASFLTGTLATLLLAVATGFYRRFADQAPDPAIALLLVVPGLVSTFLVRPGEHVMTSRLLRYVRGLTLLPGLALFAAAALLAGRPTRPVLLWGWLALVVIATIATTLLGRIAYRAWDGSPSRAGMKR